MSEIEQIDQPIDSNSLLEMIETKSYYAIPRPYFDIIKNSQLNLPQRYFLMDLFLKFLKIYRPDKNNTELLISTQKIAKEFGITIKQVYRWLKALEANQFIEKMYGGVKDSIIIGIKFVLNGQLSKKAILSTKNRKKTESKKLKSDDLSPKEQEIVDTIYKKQVNKIKLDKNQIQRTYSKMKKMTISGGVGGIKMLFKQIDFDINKNEGVWFFGKDKITDTEHKLNIILKKIKNNSYAIFTT